MTGLPPPIIHIVDDEASLRTAMSRLLTASGYRVALYENANAFLQDAHTNEPGCILLDNDMPGLSGEQLQAHLAQEHSVLPIIFLTGKGSISMSVRAIKAGAEDFLTKPAQKVDLLAAIERALTRYQATHTLQAQLHEWRRRIDSLTAREAEVFGLVTQGLLNKQIAYQLGNAERTVKAHRHAIMEKMQVRSVADLVAIASRLGLLKAKAGGSA